MEEIQIENVINETGSDKKFDILGAGADAGAGEEGIDFDRTIDDIFAGFCGPFIHDFFANIDEFFNSGSPRSKQKPDQEYPREPYLHQDYRFRLESSISGFHFLSMLGTESNVHKSFAGPSRFYNGGPRTSGYLSFLKSSVLPMATNQKGCCLLQQTIMEGTSMELHVIFCEVLLHVGDFIVNPIANHLVQTVFEVCDQEQLTQIIFQIIKIPEQLIKVSLSSHGSLAVQKLIETVRSKIQIAMIVSALEPGFIRLAKDENGYYVIEKCLECFEFEDYKFILDRAANFSLELSTHKRGCFLMQSCLRLSLDINRAKLPDRVSNYGLILAEDQYGNYAVQCLIELQIPSISSKLVDLFKGKFVRFSTQKFGSHVVERFLIEIEESREVIIDELLEFPSFGKLLMDPFANYVIQSALEHTKGGTFKALKAKIQLHSSLRNIPYCRRVFHLIRKLKR